MAGSTCDEGKLTKANLQLFRVGRYSDCNVKCGDIVFATHKAVLCERNAYFKAALAGPFREAKTATVEFDDEYAYAVEALLYWLYTFRYCKVSDITISNAPASLLEFEIEVYKIADRRQALDLMEMAAREIRGSLDCRDIGPGPSLDEVIAVIPALWDIGGPFEERIRETMMNTLTQVESNIIENADFMAVMESGGALARALFREVVSAKNATIAFLNQENEPASGEFTRKKESVCAVERW